MHHPGCRNLLDLLGNETRSGETAGDCQGVPEQKKTVPRVGARSPPCALEVPVSRCIDSGFQCLGVPMSRGRENLVVLIKKLSCRHSVNTAIPRSDNTAIPTICPVLPRQYIQGPNKTATRRGGCRTGAKASWLGVLSPSLRGKQAHRWA